MDPHEWSIDQVIDQVCSRDSQLYQKVSIKLDILDLELLENAVRFNDIDGETLLSIEDINVKDDLGIKSFGQRREIRKLINHLRRESILYQASIESPSAKRPLSDPEPETPDLTSDSKKRRRIQPENLSTVPASHVVRTESDDLEGYWRDFLERHQEASDEEILRAYGESDPEIEVESDDSLFNELEEPDVIPKNAIREEAVEQAIHEAIDEFCESWNADKRAKRYKTAYRRWMDAAKAGTRKPQQNALQHELDQLHTRLAKFRRHIAHPSMKYSSLDEIKRNCLNLQATVEDILEREYYLETLESHVAPERPLQQVSKAPKIALLADEESLQSSSDYDEEDDTMGDSDAADMMSLSSKSGVSLPYDPADDDWHPVLPLPEPASSASPHEVDSPSEEGGYDLVNRGSSSMCPESPTQQTELPLGTFRQAPSGSTPPRTTTPTPKTGVPFTTSADAEMEFFQLPESRYENLGKSLATPIILVSSPASDASEQSIRTPPLNPTTLTTPTKSKKQKLQFPDIEATRMMTWSEVSRNNPELALCKIVYRHSRANARDVLEYACGWGIYELPQALRAAIAEVQDTEDDELENVEHKAFVLWAFFFIVFATSKGYRSIWDIPEAKIDAAYEMTDAKAAEFDRILKPLLSYYLDIATKQTDDIPLSEGSSRRQPQSPSQLQTHLILPRTPPIRTKPKSSKTRTEPLSEYESDVEDMPSKGKRKRPVHQSQEALAQQRDDRNRVEMQEERRQLMLQKFQFSVAPGEVRKVIINTEEPCIYLDEHIAARIKEHQIAGVQFIWRELIEDQKHQGCLLAHTMGLGKTMQVITFLVTLAQANKSPDARVRALVPPNLQSQKVLIVCPASLVDNWFDEILMWTPPTDKHLLGGIYKIGSKSKTTKIKTVQAWNDHPGVLLISYESLRSLLNEAVRSKDHLPMLKLSLLEEPCVVISDEAHKLKNASSKINQIAHQFRTMSRIALTGSPLNNHLEEYHTMIDWIAPRYLGTITEFKAKYSEPIQLGLYEDSSRYEKRRSLNKLYVLKRDLAPKIDRKDISAIAADMPQKTEFFITVPLTELQSQIYSIIIRHILAGLQSPLDGPAPKPNNAKLWSWLSILSWLNNHPSCLIRKLQEKDAEAFQTAMDNIDGEDSVMPADLDLRDTEVAAMLPQFLECFKAVGAHPSENLLDPRLSMRALVSRYLISESIALGEKILVFSHSIPTLDFLQSMLDDMGCNYLRIDGSTRTDQRQAATKLFNEDADKKHTVFLISTRAGGLGLNLQGANRVIIYDFGFNPSWEEQAIGRAYRLGQRKPVFVYRFRAGGTFEENIYNKSIFKTQLFSRVVDQKNVIRHASRKIEDYLFEPKDVPRDEKLNECLGKDDLLDRVVKQVPDAIRNLVLTETFQREDEEDELTPEEKDAAEKAVEMERLARTDQEKYHQLIEEQKQKEIREQQERGMRAAPELETINFNHLWDPMGLFDQVRQLVPGASLERPMLERSEDTSSISSSEDRRMLGYRQQ